MGDKSQQTEKPTQRKLDKARTEGRFAVSREFVGAIQFLCFVSLLGGSFAAYFWDMAAVTRQLLKSAFSAELTGTDLLRLFGDSCFGAFMPIAKLGGVLLAVTLATHLAITRGGFAAKRLAPDFNRLNFLARATELPKQNAPLFFQALVLMPVFGVLLYGLIVENLEPYLALPLMQVEPGTRLLAGQIYALLSKAAWAFLVFGAVDLWRQHRRHEATLRMSKQEIREEAKETEANPQMKSKIRRLQRDLLRRRMMAQVPTASAVIVNPTHYAVAIRYRMDSMSAPSVVAKGKNYLALRIRQRAIEHQVPIIENPPLAQALYKSTEVGQEIPPHLYRAVAEILAYIHKLMGGRIGS